MILSKLEVLSKSEVEAIHGVSIRVLSEKGILMDNHEILELLAENGADVDYDTKIARIPESLVDRALSSLVPRITLYNRDKVPVVTLGDGKTYCASGHEAIYVLDADSQQRRPATKKDIAEFAAVADTLPNVHIVAAQATPQDVAFEATLVHAIDAMIRNTSKPMMCAPMSASDAHAIIDMVRIVQGADDLSSTPMAIVQQSTLSPLSWPSEMSKTFVDVVKSGLPFLIHTAPNSGMTAPLTLAGVLAVYNTEVLSVLVVSQLLKKGAPIIYGGGMGSFDMRLANRLIASPESALLRIALRQMSKFYGVPNHCLCPDSDSHCHDEQAGWEKMLTALCTLSSGTDLVVNSGMFSTGMVVSLEQLMMDHEILSIAYRLLEGIKVDEDRLAAEVIMQVGPRGNYITEDHTLKYLRSGEYWEPLVSNRVIYDQWRESGSPNVAKRAREEARRRIDSHQPEPLDPNVDRELSRLVDTFDERSPSEAGCK
ncbi:MAG: trimethylamine methyltransferase family protein [Armatimonadota bacterium]